MVKFDTANKVLGSTIVSLALLLAVGAVGYRGMLRSEDGVRGLSERVAPALQALHRLDAGQMATGRFLNALTLSRMTDPAMRAAVWKDQQASLARTREGWEALRKLELEEGVERSVARVDEPLQKWFAAIDRLAAAIRAKEVLDRADDGYAVADDAVWAAWLEMRALVVPLDGAMRELEGELERDVEHDREGAAEGVRGATQALAGMIAAGALALLAAGFFLSRSIRGSLRELGAEASRLAAAVRRGELDVRADEAAVAAEFRPILTGMNGTMEAFTHPLQVIGEYLDRISRGDVPPPVTEEAEGQFEVTKQALNRSIAAISRLVTDANALASAAVEGRLAVRADAAEHHGEFRAIVDGLNRTLATVVLPLREATEALEALAARDLRVRIATDHPGEYAKLKEAFNATAQALHDALSQAAESAGQVASAANQIASASESVANGASEQASALEETSASLESMTSMTKGSADNAHQASTLAGITRDAAGEGAAAMDQMAGAMARIRSSADSTSQIIKDINEIAFQTNLLALNAAVEAARAGDAGRGFAVVAEEVRALALRSKDAAQKTEELIRESVRETEAGVGTARLVAEKLAQIQGSVTKVTDIVAEIAASSKEQAAGIDQVTRAVSEMDKVTQQNAANSEQSSSAASQLSGQAAELASIVGAFQLDGRSAVRAPAVAPVRATGPARPAPRARPPAPRVPAVRARAAAKARPEEVIPLEGDAAFRDF